MNRASGGRNAHKEEIIEALTSLGLTLVQSKVFTAASVLSCSTIHEISELSKVPRQDIYRVLAELQELSLVEKMVSKPAKFRGLPMKEAVYVLIKRKGTEYDGLRRTSRKLLANLNNNVEKDYIVNRGYQFFIAKGKEALFKNIRDNLSRSKTSIDIATTNARFIQSQTCMGTLFKKKLLEGVKIRIIAEKPADKRNFLAEVGDIRFNINLQIRYVTTPLKANVAIFDKEAALVCLNVGEVLLKGPEIYVNNPSFITMFQEYFDNIWKTGKPYNTDNGRENRIKTLLLQNR
jgi:sugar-specific transcriptional regulator TrmB